MKTAARPAATPRKQPRQARSKVTVQAILEAAIHVFAAHGHAAGTTTRIAERAGVSIGSLYQYFPDKDAILTALARQHLDEGNALLATLLTTVSQPPLALQPLLEAAVHTLLQLHAQHPALHRLLYEDGLLPAAVRRELAASENRFVQAVAALLAAHPQVRAGDALLQAYFVVHTLEHFAHRLVIDPPERRIRQAGERELVALLLRYLQRPDAV